MPISSPSQETYESIVALRVVRSFTDRPIPDDVLDAVLEAGRWTGSSKNSQGWRFAVITDDETRLRLAEAGRFTGPLREAAVAIGLVRTRQGDDFDIGRLAQNLMLAAAALGLGSCPVTLHDPDVAAAVLGLPDDHACTWTVALGYPDEEREREGRASRRPAMSGRLPLDELLWKIPG
jgi:nitroreductase